MTTHETKSLAELKKEEMSARDKYERWAATNTVGQSQEDLVKIDMEFRRAFIRWDAARTAYATAVDAVLAAEVSAVPEAG